MSQQAERRIGNIIGGKWRVDSLLGTGSMAAVYAVTHRNGARAALKILHPTLCADPAVCERFLGEGYLTNSVKHPGIVRVLDDGVTDDGCVFLVMDLLEGMTLETLRQHRGGQLDVVEVLDIADKLTDALFAVHSAGIIHRDLKPQNVFVCDDGTVKLLDFGVARVLDQGSSSASMFGLVLGTPSFMSPEQAMGARDKVDHRTDIWSLGATLFTALTGQTVHLGPNVQAKLVAAATAKARSVGIVRQDLPPAIAAAIDTALRFEREDRWQSADAFRRALRDARVAVGLGKPDSTPPPDFELTHGPRMGSQHDGGTSELGAAGARDQGERALALMVRNNQAAKPRRSSRPPPTAPRYAKGPNNTFIGIGNAANLLGERAPTPEPEEPEQVEPEPIEDSYPAASSTVGEEELQVAQLRMRRPAVGIWVAAVLIAIAAIGGFAFLASRSNIDARAATSAEAPKVAPASPDPLPAPAPLPTPVATPTPVSTGVHEPDASTQKSSSPIGMRLGHSTRSSRSSEGRTSSTPPSVLARPSTPAPEPVSAPTPTPTFTAAPAPAPSPAPTPDPFGTPE